MQEMSQLFYLKRELAMEQQRLRELEGRALPGAQRLTGLPGNPNVSDKLAECAAEIADLRMVIEQKVERCLAEQQRLEKYIAGIEDSLIRQIFTCRFVEGLSWQQVAKKVGGHNTTGSVKMIVRRFLAKN